MNLIYFIRLFFKNVWLIFGVAFAMAGLVFILTGNQPKTFSASTTVYTGIATGYNIESGSNERFDMFANNAQFDNLINIIKSRQTQEKTAIRLMAQHLVLSKPDPGYCLPETWRQLMSEIPIEIKRMVEMSYSTSYENNGNSGILNQGIQQTNRELQDSIAQNNKDTVRELQTKTKKVKRFRVNKNYYTIKAGDSPNAVSEKFGLTLDELQRLNSPMPPFHGGQRLVVGTLTEPYWEDTLVKREVSVANEQATSGSVLKEQVTARQVPSDLDAFVFDSGTNAGLVSDENLLAYNRLIQLMTEFKNADQDNYLFNTLQSSNPYYSVEKISSVKVTRIQSSDLIKLTFESDDPAVCMQTLRILTEVFKSEYQSITAKQTGNVAEYFRLRVTEAKRQLDSLEQDLLHFRMKNRIINYDEQTKFISEQKEILDKDWYEEAGNFSAAKTALALIEENLDEKGQSVLQNNSVLEKRKKVYELALQISMEEVKSELDTVGEFDIENLTRLKSELERLKIELNRELLNSYDLSRTVQGLNIQSVLQKWLEQAIEVEESQARYNTLTNRKNVFLRKYDEFAPLGSQLKKIEREITLAQEDYMNHLNNLNQSIIKQKNVEQSEIQIIDSPVYPLKPIASGRMLTILAAFMAGLVLTISVIILLEFLDTSIKFPRRLEELSGLKLVGAYPEIPLYPDRNINYPLITSRAIDQITQRISLEDLRQKDRGDQPFILFFISSREKEGKTYLATRVGEKLRASGSKVLYIKPREKNSQLEEMQQFNSFDQTLHAWDYEYDIPDHFIMVRNINELLRNYTFLTKGYNYLIIELPALLSQDYPATLAESGNLSILICRAGRTWNKADDEAVKLYQSNIHHPVMALLNACHVDRLESIIGEIPRRRNFLRKLMRKIVDQDFKMRGI